MRGCGRLCWGGSRSWRRRGGERQSGAESGSGCGSVGRSIRGGARRCRRRREAGSKGGSESGSKGGSEGRGFCRCGSRRKSRRRSSGGCESGADVEGRWQVDLLAGIDSRRAQAVGPHQHISSNASPQGQAGERISSPHCVDNPA